MSDKYKKTKELVFPGSKLGVIEEFIPGKGTYEKGGSIYSKIIGNADLDAINKEASVRSSNKNPILPSKDSIVTGIVSGIQGKAATLDIYKINDHTLRAPFTGMLHVSRCSPKYERGINDVCKLADLIRAKVVDVKDGFIKINTVDAKLGVIRAFCSNCGNILVYKRNKLKCKKCGNFEKRKVSDDYLEKEFNGRHEKWR
jgi:exosome complex component CSL4